MTWMIIQQETKDDFVDCKVVTRFPQTDNKGNVVGFGFLPRPTFRVYVTHDGNLAADESEKEKLVAIRWTPKPGTPAGVFTIELPGKWVYPKLQGVTRVRKGLKTTFEDTLSPKVFEPGHKSRFESFEAFEERLSFLGETKDTVLDALNEAVTDYAAE